MKGEIIDLLDDGWMKGRKEKLSGVYDNVDGKVCASSVPVYLSNITLIDIYSGIQ